MNFFLISVLATSALISPIVFAKNTSPDQLQKIENMVLSCSQIDKDLNSDLIYRCLNNGHQLVKKEINTKLNSIGVRDKASTINTKGLDFEVLRYNCEQIFSIKNLRKECQIYADISYLNYLITRF